MGSLLRSKNFVSQLVQRRFVPSSDFVTSDILAGRAELQNSAAVRRLLIAPYNRVSAQGTGTVRGSHKLPRTNRRIADVRDASARRGRARPSWNARRIPSAERAYYARKRRPLKIKVAGTDQMREAELVLLGVPRVPPACGGDA
jgi:hypothetical protein